MALPKNLLDGIVQQEAIVVLGREIVDQLPSLPAVQGANHVHYQQASSQRQIIR